MGWSCWLSLVSRTTSAATIKAQALRAHHQLGIITLDIALFGRRRQGAVRVSGIKGVSPPGCWSYSPRFIPRRTFPGLGFPFPHTSAFGPAFPVRPWRPATGSGVLAHQPVPPAKALAIFPLLIGGFSSGQQFTNLESRPAEPAPSALARRVRVLRLVALASSLVPSRASTPSLRRPACRAAKGRNSCMFKNRTEQRPVPPGEI